MVFGIKSEEKSNNTVPLRSVVQAQIIRDERFTGALPHRGKTQGFCSYDSSVFSILDDIEQRIAFAYDKKDIIDLAKLLCEPPSKPIVRQKTRNSPLYVYITPQDEKTKNLEARKNGIIETALFLLVNDEKVALKDISESFKRLMAVNSSYKPSSKLIGAFYKRLGIIENLKKKDEIIEKLKNMGKGLGFTE